MRLIQILNLILCAVVAASSAHAAAPEEQLSPSLLLAARSQWMQSLSIKSTFVYREGTAGSREKTLENDPFDNVRTTARGIFCKKQDLIRYKIDYDDTSLIENLDPITGEPALNNGTGKRSERKKTVRHPSQDEVHDGRLLLSYTPRWDDLFDTAMFISRSSFASHHDGGGCSQTELQMSPINPVPGCNRHFPGGISSAKSEIHYKIESNPSGGVTVVAEDNSSIGGRPATQRYRADWILDHEFPMINRAYFELQIDGKTTVSESRLTDLRDCGGTLVASRVISVVEHTDSPTLVREWRSEDIGNELPTDEDFVIQIPETTTIFGLKTNPPTGTARRLAVADTTLDDLRPKSPPEKEQPSPQTQVFRQSRGVYRDLWTWLIWGNVITAVIVGSLVYWLRFKGKAK